MRFAYYRSVARAVGVPEFWVWDAGQDIAFTCWRRGNDNPGTVRSAAIDAARRYGPYARVREGRGMTLAPRLPMVSLEHHAGLCAC